jgi:hypothetical protein
MQYEYLATVQFTGVIDIDNIGNVCLEALNDFGMMWLLCIKTVEGQTEVIEYGPILVDIDKLSESVYYTYDRFQFDSRKIDRRIEQFINNPKRIITQVNEIDIKDCKERIISMIDKIGDE